MHLPDMPTYIVSIALTACPSHTLCGRIYHHPHPLGELSNLGIHLLVDGPVRHSGDALLAGDFVDAWVRIYIISLYPLFHRHCVRGRAIVEGERGWYTGSRE